MELSILKSILEALIFVSEEPVTINLISTVLAETGIEKEEIKAGLEALKSDYESEHHGFALTEVAGGYQFRTKTEMSEWIGKLNVPKPTRLSQAAMETLAIVAYQQPLTRADVEEIRGVDSGGVLKTLLERNLVRILGKRDEVGSPLIYGTTPEFMSVFNLKSLKDLPTLREMSDLEEQHYGTSGRESTFGGTSATGSVAEVVKNMAIEGLPEEERVRIDLEDQRTLRDLDDEIKSVRDLEKGIFPKPKENFAIVLNPDSGMGETNDTQQNVPAETNTHEG